MYIFFFFAYQNTRKYFVGVTLIRPDELEFPSTMTDIDHDTWMLSGSNVMRDGVILRNNYACDLDKLVEGNRIGMMRCSDSSLHYYLDGVDQGPACTGVPSHIYPVIELYGQCVQVYYSIFFYKYKIIKDII